MSRFCVQVLPQLGVLHSFPSLTHRRLSAQRHTSRQVPSEPGPPRAKRSRGAFSKSHPFPSQTKPPAGSNCLFSLAFPGHAQGDYPAGAGPDGARRGSAPCEGQATWQ